MVIDKAGFTLVESAIVLVVISLTVGGIFVGASLIRAAELRSVLTDVERFNSAFMAFRLKFNAIPGDMHDAETYWGSDTGCPTTPGNLVPKAATCNGNGDWRIGHTDGLDLTYLYEWYRAWQHLASAGLVAGQYTGAYGPSGPWEAIIGTNVPASRVSGAGFLASGHAGNVELYPAAQYSHWIYLAKPDPASQGRMVAPVLSGRDAYSTDVKVDDGQPGTGKITTLVPAYLPCADNADPALARYIMIDSNIRCLLLFRASL